LKGSKKEEVIKYDYSVAYRSDEHRFFEELIRNCDLDDLKHYGVCLRLSGHGYHIGTMKSYFPNTVLIRVANDDKSMMLDRLLNTGNENMYIVELKSLLREIFQWLEENDSESLVAWVNQLKSSIDVVEEVAEKSRVISK